MRWSIIGFFLLAGSLSQARGAAESDTNFHLQDILARAQALELAQHPQWLALLHAMPRRFSPGFVSTIDQSSFFLAPDGKTNPHSELIATLTRFFDADPLPGRTEPALCAFIARYRWLDSQLAFRSQYAPKQACPEFDAWYTQLRPENVTLIFPAAYMNNPSSLFGHTLLRIDPAQSVTDPLLSYAVNYGAQTHRDGGFLFAFKGIFGVYSGFYGLGPYYDRVNAYSNIENRDIWEYKLNLTADEIRRLVEHVWELRQVGTDYYFFDENCSYQLLALLDVARPGSALRQAFSAWVIPSDTVRAIEQRGLISDVKYRAAASTKLRARLNDLGEHQRRLAHDIVNTNLSPQDPSVTALPQAMQAKILDVAHDYLHYEFVARKRQRDRVAPQLFALLQQRSTLPTTAEPAPAIPIRPEHGHRTARASVGAEYRDGRSSPTFRLMPAYHELLDPSAGYLAGAQIQFLDARFAFNTVEGSVQLSSFMLVDIISLSARDLFFRPTSWTVSAGWIPKLLPEQDDALTRIPTFHIGAGGTLALGGESLTYGLATVTLERDGTNAPRYALGPGVQFGSIWAAGESVSLGVKLHAEHFQVGSRYTRYGASIEQRWHINRDASLTLELSDQRIGSINSPGLNLNWTVFF